MLFVEVSSVSDSLAGCRSKSYSMTLPSASLQASIYPFIIIYMCASLEGFLLVYGTDGFITYLQKGKVVGEAIKWPHKLL